MKTINRLEELLDQKDLEIEELQNKVREYEDTSERDWEWSRHVTLEKDLYDLPVPRLQIVCINKGNWYNWEWTYLLVYKHFLDNIVHIPLGFTKVGGSGGMPVRDNKIDLPIRDGAHIMHDAKNLNLPAFAIIEDKIEKLN